MNSSFLVIVFSFAVIFKFGITSPVHTDDKELTTPLLHNEADIASPVAQEEIVPEAKENQPPAAQTTAESAAKPAEPKSGGPKKPIKLIDYDVQRVAARAAAKVYGWLPAEKQPKAISDAEAAKNAPKPPGDYDVERVAAKAAHFVYGWLPEEAQPAMNRAPTDETINAMFDDDDDDDSIETVKDEQKKKND